MIYQKTLAYATVVLALFAVLNYFFPLRTELLEGVQNVKVKEVLKEERKKIEITVDKDIYRGERNWLLEMYRASTKMPYPSTKAEALMKVVQIAIKEKDFNISIIAANKMPYNSKKAEALKLIVQAAVKDRDSYGYAVIAAEKMPYSSSKAEALTIIVNAGEELLRKDKISKKDFNSNHIGPSLIKKNKNISETNTE